MKQLKNNPKLVEIFDSMANIYSMQNVQWKPQAYKRVARSLEELREDVSEVYRKGGLKAVEKIGGVGESIGKKIVEFLDTGKIKTYEKLKKTVPGGLLEMMKVPGIGPKRAKVLYEKLGIKNVGQLEKAAKAGKIKKLETFKEKSEKNILENITLYKGRRERIPLEIALKEAKIILKELKKVKGVKRLSEAGSMRRKEKTIGDLDLLVSSSDSKKVIDKFVNLKNVKKIIAKGDTKASILLNNDLQVDLRVIPDSEFGSALQYFTGNKAHNILLRKIAIRKGMKLSEYGLFLKGKNIASRNEKDIYDKLNVIYVRPEERQGKNEVREK